MKGELLMFDNMSELFIDEVKNMGTEELLNTYKGLVIDYNENYLNDSWRAENMPFYKTIEAEVKNRMEPKETGKGEQVKTVTIEGIGTCEVYGDYDADEIKNILIKCDHVSGDIFK
jgi:hypothetical protein